MVEDEKTVRHKQPRYLVVFFALAGLTAVEVAVTQLPLPRAPILIPLSIIKAALVGLFYMHLRTDRRIFAVVFGLGLLLGIAFLVSLVILLNTPFGGVPGR